MGDHSRPTPGSLSAVGSLFSGYGASPRYRARLQRGDDPVLSEIDGPVARVFARHWPDALDLGGPHHHRLQHRATGGTSSAAASLVRMSQPWQASFAPGTALGTRAEKTPHIDSGGATTFVAGLAALMLAVTQGSSLGWTSPIVLALLAGVALLLTVFVVIERRAGNPILNLSLQGQRRFMGWLLAAITMSIGFGGVLNFLPSYLQDPGGLTAANAGLVMILPTVGGALISKGSSPVLVITAALLAITVGNAWLATLQPTITPLELAGPLLLLGAGVGLASGTIDAQAMNEVSERQVGMAAGMLNTVRGTSNALILGLFGSALIAILTGKTDSARLAGQVATGNLPDSSDADFLAAQLTDTWQIVLIALTAVCGLATLVTAALVRRSPGRNWVTHD